MNAIIALEKCHLGTDERACFQKVEIIVEIIIMPPGAPGVFITSSLGRMSRGDFELITLFVLAGHRSISGCLLFLS